MKKIIHVVSIDAPRHEVFDAVTKQSGLSSWWSTKVEASEDVGGEIHFTFVGDFNPVMEVLTRDDNQSVEWKCKAGHEPWKDNKFRFRLRDVDGRTQLTFTQDYAQELSDEAYGTYNYNWGYYLESLKQYCETGQGKPYVPD
jgi:uncharacterized protein YndB with AHSA1/START domain